ncbi:hypothetical protein IV102_25385 [bacterium]|nr:hypothetical protein [bacterium]
MFATLLAWIRCTEIEVAEVAETRTLVQSSLDALSFEDPRRPQLLYILDCLWQGTIPVDDLLDLADQWEEEVIAELPVDVQHLEQEFRNLASALPSIDWHSRSYGRLLKALDQLDSGSPEAFYEYLDSKRQLLEEAWARYAQTPVLHSEVTAESVVGHRLLQSAIDAWMYALDLLEQAAENRQSFSPGLAQAEVGNRLLTAVDRLNDRTQALTHGAGRRT